jgi:dTDP-4-amino-4,6-dideoxygalactose transaminase
MLLGTPKERNLLQEHLKRNGIPSMIYYPLPLYKQAAYKQKVSLPVTEFLCDRILALPIGTEMETEQLDYIISNIKSYFNQLNS